MKDLEFYLVMGFTLIAMLVGLSYLVYQLVLSLSQITIITIY